MLKTVVLDLPYQETWLEFDATGKNTKITNPTTIVIYYAFEDDPATWHTLGTKESIPFLVSQLVYFKRGSQGSYTEERCYVNITEGAEDIVAMANLSQGIGAEWAIKLDSWGLQKVSQDYRLWRDTFCTGISKKVWNIKALNGTSFTRQGSGVFSSGKAISDYYTSFSRKHSRYQPNSGILFNTAGAVPNATATGGIRRFGIATIEDGYFFEISEDGIMYVVVRQSDFQNYTTAAGQDTFGFDYNIVASSTVYARVKYDGEVLWQDITSDIATIDTTSNEVTMTTPLSANDEICIVSVNDIKNEITSNLIANGIDPTNQILYDIQAQWRGAGNVTFTVRSESTIGISQGFQAVYRNLGQTDRANISTPALSAFVECKNISSAGTDFQLKLGCMNIAAEGGQKDVEEYESIVSPNAPTITTGDTGDDEVFLMIGHIPKYYNGRLNTRDAEAVRISAWSDQKSHMNIYTSEDPLFLTGGLLLKEKDEDSCILYDNNLDATNTTARNNEIDLNSVSVITRARVQIDNTQTIIKPCESIEYVVAGGEYIIVTGQRELTAGASNMGAAIEIGERT